MSASDAVDGSAVGALNRTYTHGTHVRVGSRPQHHTQTLIVCCTPAKGHVDGSNSAHIDGTHVPVEEPSTGGTVMPDNLSLVVVKSPHAVHLNFENILESALAFRCQSECRLPVKLRALK
jgi:hypothetical protein